MKRKSLLVVLTVVLAALVLSACAAFDTSGGDSAMSEADKNIAKYEELILTDSSEENMMTLAVLYQDAGYIRKQRDTLEACYLLHQNKDALEALESVVVNIEEESDAVKGKALSLLNKLTDEETQNEAVTELLNGNWQKTMMPKLIQGQRNYYFEDAENEQILFVKTGYNAANSNTFYSKIWYKDEAGDKLTYLTHEGDALQLLNTTTNGGEYNGAFTSWLCLGDSGTVYLDEGELSDGLLSGEFTSSVHAGAEPIDLVELFASRDTFERIAYTGSFDGGIPAVEQADEGEFTIYAYNEDKTDYLYYFPTDEAENNNPAFNHTFLGLEPVPEFESYTPVKAEKLEGKISVDLSKLEIRIINGDVEWFDGERWHTVGSAESLLQKDPFYNLEPQTEIPEGDDAEQAAQQPWFARRGQSAAADPAAELPDGTAGDTAGAATPRRGTSSSGGTSPSSPSPSPQPKPKRNDDPDYGKDGEDTEWTPDIL